MDPENEQSLYDVISSAFDESSESDNQKSEIPENKESRSAANEDKQDDNESDSIDEIDSQDNGDVQESKGIDGTEKISPPEHWSQADKEAFASATKEVQEWALRRDKDMTADYTKKTTEIADFKKTWDPVQQMFAPYIAQGVNPSQVISQWAQIAQQLQQNPAQTLQNLAQQYRVSLTNNGQNDTNGLDDVYRDPKIEQLEQTVRQLTGHLQQRDQLEQQTKVRSMETDIEAFASQKTEAGDPAHPFFDELLPDMSALARAAWAAGMQPKLQDLYERALWANPETRAKTLEAQQKAAAKKAEQEAIAKAKKSKTAGKSVGGSSSTSKQPVDLGIRESLESLWPD